MKEKKHRIFALRHKQKAAEYNKNHEKGGNYL